MVNAKCLTTIDNRDTGSRFRLESVLKPPGRVAWRVCDGRMRRYLPHYFNDYFKYKFSTSPTRHHRYTGLPPASLSSNSDYISYAVTALFYHSSQDHDHHTTACALCTSREGCNVLSLQPRSWQVLPPLREPHSANCNQPEHALLVL